LVVGVRGRKLGSVTQRRDHGVASNIKVIRVTIELDGGPEKHEHGVAESASSGCR
jgi:hypothetical protein